MRPSAALSLVALCAAATCDRAGAGAGPARAIVLGAQPSDGTDSTCSDAGVRPATGAPAQGVWLYDMGEHRIAAIVGPAQAVAGRAQLTRRVETVEARGNADTLRFASDTATIRLQFLPPTARPAAVYALGPRVLLAAYEPCTPGLLEPLIRYLRRDPAGHVVTDVILRREPAAP